MYSSRFFGHQRMKLLMSVLLFAHSSRGIQKLNNQPLFRFGVISDIQYAQSDNAMNFQGTKWRRYRQSLEIYRAAINSWQNLDSLDFALVLGDLIDGKSVATDTQSQCLDDILRVSASSKLQMFYCFGNHCHYSMSRSTMTETLLSPKLELLTRERPEAAPLGGLCNPSKVYYDFSPYPGWRFVSLDSYDISLIGASIPQNKVLADEWLRVKNPNDLTQSGTWFNNLPLEDYRWVPYNGGVSREQLRWFDSVLGEAKNRGERAVVFCHQPVWAPNKPQSLIWNAEEVLEVTRRHGNVCAWLAGHDHDGQYYFDGDIHHLVPPAPLESEPGGTAYGHIDVFEDRLSLTWTGRQPPHDAINRPFDSTMNMMI